MGARRLIIHDSTTALESIQHANTVIKKRPNLIIISRNELLHSTVKFYCIGLAGMHARLGLKALLYCRCAQRSLANSFGATSF